MSTAALILAAGAAAVLGLVFWPESRPWQVAQIKGALPSRLLSPGRLAAVLLPLAVLVAGVVYSTPLMGAMWAILAGLCAWALSIRSRSAVNLAEAEQIAQFTAGLANQATVAPTVIEAVREAAPLVSGRVGEAARKMVEELRIGSLSEAAERFAAELGRPLAAMTANVLVEAHSGGIKWVELVEILDMEAGEAAQTARHFHHSVGRMMMQVVLTLAVSVGVVAITALTAQSSRDWLGSGGGQSMLVAAVAMLAMFHAWVFARAQGELR